MDSRPILNQNQRNLEILIHHPLERNDQKNHPTLLGLEASMTMHVVCWFFWLQFDVGVNSCPFSNCTYMYCTVWMLVSCAFVSACSAPVPLTVCLLVLFTYNGPLFQIWLPPVICEEFSSKNMLQDMLYPRKITRKNWELSLSTSALQQHFVSLLRISFLQFFSNTFWNRF